MPRTMMRGAYGRGERSLAVIFLLCLTVAIAGLKCSSGKAGGATEEATHGLWYPMLIDEVRPEYPEEAKQARWEGKVWVEVLVGESGLVEEVKLLKSSGHKELDDSATEAAWKNKFSPAIQSGKPVKAWFTYSVWFSLPDETTDEE